MKKPVPKYAKVAIQVDTAGWDLVDEIGYYILTDKGITDLKLGFDTTTRRLYLTSDKVATGSCRFIIKSWVGDSLTTTFDLNGDTSFNVKTAQLTNRYVKTGKPVNSTNLRRNDTIRIVTVGNGCSCCIQEQLTIYKSNDLYSINYKIPRPPNRNEQNEWIVYTGNEVLDSVNDLQKDLYEFDLRSKHQNGTFMISTAWQDLYVNIHDSIFIFSGFYNNYDSRFGTFKRSFGLPE